MNTYWQTYRNDSWEAFKQGLREGPRLFFAPLIVLWRLFVKLLRAIESTQDELLRASQARYLRRVRAKRLRD